ncbi:L,D-transpeptidase [Phyllobacterium brassicacearum]|uniref:L,D-transpeptidase n=1 Tax=Phyllobacterium brassicacearum TaxID=314235 RepID=A0A2P7BUQ5_9HYPH|nr:L,D-transpeptidase [Phyllobacterium brassicacearum]PSH70186.1 L,D-transpeptidase [Phyllobacterium brassicacearum]TDQ33929.1 L,D-transpeptidase-like protein [Phyllobacterium brassicacearum]
MAVLKSGTRVFAVLFAVGLFPVSIGALAQTREPSPPVLDKKNRKVWLQPGYIDFLMGSESYPPRHSRSASASASSIHTAIARQMVAYATHEKPGTIIIETQDRALYLVQPNGRALRYSIGVGREGYGWRGTERISSKREWPEWRPPADMLARRPDLPAHMAGGPDNPLGARALYLGNTLYRIHGSNEPGSVGQSSSSGCFRMTNDDVVDLSRRVKVGTKVVVL